MVYSLLDNDTFRTLLMVLVFLLTHFTPEKQWVGLDD